MGNRPGGELSGCTGVFRWGNCPVRSCPDMPLPSPVPGGSVGLLWLIMSLWMELINHHDELE